MFIDTHCHLDFDRFDDDRDEVVNRAAQAGVQQIIVPAIEQNNIAAVLELAVIYPNV